MSYYTAVAALVLSLFSLANCMTTGKFEALSTLQFPSFIPTNRANTRTTRSTSNPRSGDFRLEHGCRGNFQIYGTSLTSGSEFFEVCERNFGVEEAQVLCRQLGCNPIGARRSSASLGYFVTFYRSNGYRCTGEEASLSQCSLISGSCGVSSTIEQEDVAAFVAVTCGPSPPSEPRDLVVEGISPTSLRVSWSSPVDSGGSSLRSAQVILVDPVTSEERVIATINRGYEREYLISDAGLTESTTYTVKVRLANGVGYGPSAATNGTTLSVGAPRRPLNAPYVNPSSQSAVVSWQYPGGSVTSYVVQYARAARLDREGINVTVNQTSVELTGLQSRTWYDVRVATQNSEGISSFSPSRSFITSRPPTTRPPLRTTTRPPFSSSSRPPFRYTTRPPFRYTRPPFRYTTRPPFRYTTRPSSRFTSRPFRPRFTSRPPTSSSASAQSVEVVTGIVIAISLFLGFCVSIVLVFIKYKARRSLINYSARPTNTSARQRQFISGQQTATSRHQFQLTPQTVGQQRTYLMTSTINGGNKVAATPTVNGTLVSADPPSYDEVQRNKDLCTDNSLPPSYAT